MEGVKSLNISQWEVISPNTQKLEPRLIFMLTNSNIQYLYQLKPEEAATLSQIFRISVAFFQNKFKSSQFFLFIPHGLSGGQCVTRLRLELTSAEPQKGSQDEVKAFYQRLCIYRRKTISQERLVNITRFAVDGMD